jgi:hypothetical protein
MTIHIRLEAVSSATSYMGLYAVLEVLHDIISPFAKISMHIDIRDFRFTDGSFDGSHVYS